MAGMSEIGEYGLKGLEIAGMAGNGWEWLEMAGMDGNGLNG